MTALKTVEYTCKSDKNKIYSLPEESVKEADHIMKYILKVDVKDSNKLINIVNDHYYFGNINRFARSDLLSIARKIVEAEKGTLESLRLQDEFYIKTGLYEACRVREKVKEMNESLTDALNELENSVMRKENMDNN